MLFVSEAWNWSVQIIQCGLLCYDTCDGRRKITTLVHWSETIHSKWIALSFYFSLSLIWRFIYLFFWKENCFNCSRGQLFVHLLINAVRNVKSSRQITCPTSKLWRIAMTLTVHWEWGPLREPRRFQIYRWINWQRSEQLTGHSSWWALARCRAQTRLLCFDFLSWLAWQMNHRVDGGKTGSRCHAASPLCTKTTSLHSLKRSGHVGSQIWTIITFRESNISYKLPIKE